MNKITTCLWFDGGIEEAAKFYTEVFKGSKIVNEAKFPSDAPDRKEGEAMVSELEIGGARIMLLNGGSVFKQSEAASLIIDCEDQAEVDYYWEKLIEGGGQESQCGWLKDKFGVSWQVTPKMLTELTYGSDKEKAKKAFEAMMSMKKIIIADLEKAMNS